MINVYRIGPRSRSPFRPDFWEQKQKDVGLGSSRRWSWDWCWRRHSWGSFGTSTTTWGRARRATEQLQTSDKGARKRCCCRRPWRRACWATSGSCLDRSSHPRWRSRRWGWRKKLQKWKLQLRPFLKRLCRKPIRKSCQQQQRPLNFLPNHSFLPVLNYDVCQCDHMLD